jgi:RHS repeat-associated protein
VPRYETIYVGDQPVAVVTQTRSGSGGSVSVQTNIGFVYADHLDTPRVIARSDDQAIVWRWDLAEAFGATPANDNPSGLGTFTFNQRFPGQVFDAETGLHYNWHRVYIPSTGRYAQSDPIGLNGGINTFIYVENNPLLIIDPMGWMGGSGSGAGARGPGPSIGPFGCMGIFCVGSSTQSPLGFSVELTLGGGIEICDPPPPPPPEPEICKKNDKYWERGMYGTTQKPDVQPPGIPVPKKLGTPFFAPSWKKNGQFCLRIGVFGSLSFPTPSVDLGSLKN